MNPSGAREEAEMDLPDKDGETQTSQTTSSGRVRKLTTIAVFLVFFPIFIFILQPNVRGSVIRPHKPQFTLQEITFYNLSAVSVDPSLVSSMFQTTISSRNPNSRIGMYYETVEPSVTYRNLPVTSRVEIPHTYQGHESSVAWSMLVSGTSIPLAPYIRLALFQDLVNGMTLMVIKLDGHVRWRLGVLAKGAYHITVQCPASLTFGAYSTGIPIGNDAIKYRVLQSCDVNFSR